MTLTFGNGSGNVDATEIHVGTASGNKQVTEGWVGSADGNKQFYALGGGGGGGGSLSATADPTSLAWEPAFPTPFATAEVTINPTGGTAPYTYGWVVDGDALIIGDSSQTARFTSDSGDPQTATCTVTDAALATTQVEVEIT